MVYTVTGKSLSRHDLGDGKDVDVFCPPVSLEQVWDAGIRQCGCSGAWILLKWLEEMGVICHSEKLRDAGLRLHWRTQSAMNGARINCHIGDSLAPTHISLAIRPSPPKQTGGQCLG